jgi:hypothetical protein
LSDEEKNLPQLPSHLIDEPAIRGSFFCFSSVTGAAAFQESCNRGCRLSGNLQSELAPFRKPATGAGAFQETCNRSWRLSDYL